MPKMLARSRLVRKKHLPAPFGAISGNVFHGPEKCQTLQFLFAIFLGGPMAAIQPVWSNGCNISAAIHNFDTIIFEETSTRSPSSLDGMDYLLWLDSISKLIFECPVTKGRFLR